MFTGIIEEVGSVLVFDKVKTGARLVIGMTFGDVKDGESISVNGCCLTATRLSEGRFEADLSAETLARTTLGGLSRNSKVNLERSVPAGGRMGGHVVQGHVDGVGTIASMTVDGDMRTVGFKAPPALMPFLVEKGAIAVNGVSLTVNSVSKEGFGVTLVPFTLAHTTFGSLGAGAEVNLEGDVVAKYVLRGVETLLGKSLPGGASDIMKEVPRG